MLASGRFRLKARHLITLLLLSTALLIQSAQSLPLSSQSLMKAPLFTNTSDSIANAGLLSASPSNESTTINESTTSNESAQPEWATWSAKVSNAPAPLAGCFVATYPSTVWQSTQCVTAPLVPLQPSPAAVGGAGSATVGNGVDEVAHAPSGKLIGSSIGSYQVSGLTSETDSMFGANNYGLQINSQTFTTSTTYTGGKSTTGWEQFVWINYPAANSAGFGYIQYWLLGYQSSYGSCPSTGPPGGSSWAEYSGDCYANSPGFETPLEAPTNLASLSLEGFSSYNGAVNDVDMLCVSGGSCYSVSITEQVVNLYQNWQYSEFNVFGVGDGSQANFNSGTTITVTNTLKDQSANVIVPSCVNSGYTGETNNLNLGSCSSNSNGQIVFTESNGSTQTLTSTVSTQTTILRSSTTTTTVMSYTSSAASTSTVVSLTTVLAPVTKTVTSTVSMLTTFLFPETTTTTIGSYTGTVTVTSPTVVYTTIGGTSTGSSTTTSSSTSSTTSKSTTSTTPTTSSSTSSTTSASTSTTTTSCHGKGCGVGKRMTPTSIYVYPFYTITLLGLLVVETKRHHSLHSP